MKIVRTVKPEVPTVTNTIVKVTRSVLINGVVLKPGALAEVSHQESLDLTHRRCAVEASAAEVEAASAIIASGTVDGVRAHDRVKLIPGEAWGR